MEVYRFLRKAIYVQNVKIYGMHYILRVAIIENGIVEMDFYGKVVFNIAQVFISIVTIMNSLDEVFSLIVALSGDIDEVLDTFEEEITIRTVLLVAH